MAAIPTPAGTPPAARGLPTSAGDLSRLAKAKADSNRMFVIALGLMVVIAALCAVLFVMMPLKRTEPIIVERDSSTGAVKAVATHNEVYKPTQNDLKYFLHRYVVQVVTIHRLTTERDIEDARTHFTRGKAVSQLDSFFDRERPIYRLRGDPGLTRKVEVGSVSLFKDGAVVKFSTVEQGSAEKEPRRTKMVATIQYNLIPPEDEKAVFANPAGMFITDLDFARDLEN